MKRFTVLPIVLLLTFALLLSSCANSKPDATANENKSEIETNPSEPFVPTAYDIDRDLPIDKQLSLAQMSFALDLFKSEVHFEKEGENILLSPLSVQLALALTANGAAGETAEQMLDVLAAGHTSEELNNFLSDMMIRMEEPGYFKLNMSNSVWFKDKDFSVNKDFLGKASDYYDAEVFEKPFDEGTVGEINEWVNKNTDGMIEKIIDELDKKTIMCLINTILFDAEWDEPYYEYSVSDGTFNSYGGNKRTVDMMHSSEKVYLSDENAEGFIKPYKGNRYSFAALLPDEDVDIYDYISSLSAERLQSILAGEKHNVIATMPKFECDFDSELSENLKAMGMPLAFDDENADFSGFGTAEGNIFIGQVLHSTHISVTEDGTKAGAATLVDVMCGAAYEENEPKEVILDRPFVYMIIENETNLPIFMGVLCDTN